MSDRHWWQWPRGYGYVEPGRADFRPLYEMTWKVCWLPLVLVTFAFFYVAVVMMAGPSEAERIRKGLF